MSPRSGRLGAGGEWPIIEGFDSRSIPPKPSIRVPRIDMIEIRPIAAGDPLEFEVVVREGKGETRHHVTMSQRTCDELTAGEYTPEQCLRAAFQFLLDREPKESILSKFDVTAISRYFPEFQGELQRYLARV